MGRPTPSFAAQPLQAIQAAHPTLSNGQRRVTDYLCQNYRDTVFQTASEIAQRVGVSTSTVTRLAPALGYAGFPAFQQAFRELVRSERSTVSRLGQAMAGRARGRDLVSQVFASDLENLRRTHAELDRAALDRAATAILRADRVFVLGLRSSHAVAVLIHFALELVLGTSRLLAPGIGDLMEQASTIGRRDVVVAVSVARYTRQTYEVLEQTRSRARATVVITDKVTSPPASLGDSVLLAQTSLSSFVESYVAPLSVVNALVTMIAARARRRASQRLANFERLWKEARTYL